MNEYHVCTVIPSEISDAVSYAAAFVLQQNLPRTWSPAKHGARAQGFGLCAKGFVCPGFGLCTKGFWPLYKRACVSRFSCYLTYSRYLAIPIPHCSRIVESQVSMLVLD